MTTLKETIKKLNKLYSELYDSNDGFACSMIINDIEIDVKQYTTESIKASLEKASESGLIRHDFNNLNDNKGISQKRFIIDSTPQFYEIDKKSITNPENIVLL